MGPENTKLFIVEDDANIRDNLCTLLEEIGYITASSETGLDAIDQIFENPPDLILCDILLPDITGYDILKEVLQRRKTKAIPFIFLTAKSEMSDLRKGMEMGADDYLIKPISNRELLNAIKTRLEKTAIRTTQNNNSSAGQQSSKISKDDVIFLQHTKDYKSIAIKDIIYIEGDGVYSRIHTFDGKRIHIRKLIKEWMELLPEESFIRIRKSIIVNKQYVSKIEKWFNGAFRLYLENMEDPFMVSRKYSSDLRRNNIIQ